MSSFFSEIRRRKVGRVAVVYAAAGWVAIEVADTVFPHLGLPSWSVPAVIALVIIGFPIALVLAWAFQITPDGVERTGPLEPDAPPASRPERLPSQTVAGPMLLRHRSVWLMVGFLIALASAWFLVEHDSATHDEALDDGLVAVLPFRVSGNASLGYLREGMVDLMAATLTGEGGLRAVDPRSMMAAWREISLSAEADLPKDAARTLARRLGARWVLNGSVVHTPPNLSVTASLVDVTTGETRPADRVQGPVDSLPALVDRVTTGLLVQAAGEASLRRSSLADLPGPAVRSYLDGKAAYRGGDYTQAIAHLERALEIDSTFALAALYLSEAYGWHRTGRQMPVLRLAWAARDRLSERDRAYLTARVGPNYPAGSTGVEMIAAAERAVAAAPDRPETWYRLGDYLLHSGVLAGLEDAVPRARSAFERALELDPSFAGPLQHSIELAAEAGDTATVLRLGRIALASGSPGTVTEYIRWHMTRASGDRAALDALRASFDTLTTDALQSIAINAMLRGLPLDGAEEASRIVAERAGTEAERTNALVTRAVLELNAGRPGAAQRLLDRLPADPPSPRPDLELLAGLLGDGDTAVAAQAAVRLARYAAADTADPPDRLIRLCLARLWTVLREGSPNIAATTDDRLRAPGAPVLTLCADMLDAARAVRTGAASARAAVERLDSILRTVPDEGSFLVVANLVAARLFEAIGRPASALAAVRRHPVGTGQPQFMATVMREQGRLAASVGDTATAIEAYRRYLALRSDHEPALRPQVERVREALATLTGETAR